MNENTIKTRMTRGKEKLKNIIEEEWKYEK